MRAFAAAIAAVAVADVASASNNHRHVHNLFNKRNNHNNTELLGNNATEVCVPITECSTIYETIYGEPTLLPQAPIVPSQVASSAVKPPAVVVTPTIPTPEVLTCQVPSTCTFPATTLVVTETTTVCDAVTTKLPKGTHTIGGVTTTVPSATTVTCPVAVVETRGDVTTSTIRVTEFVCPTAGVYTIGAHTTACEERKCTAIFPTPSVVECGTYVKPPITVTATKTEIVTVCPFSKSSLVKTDIAKTDLTQTTTTPAPSVSVSVKVPPAPIPVVKPSVSTPSTASTDKATTLPPLQQPKPVPALLQQPKPAPALLQQPKPAPALLQQPKPAPALLQQPKPDSKKPPAEQTKPAAALSQQPKPVLLDAPDNEMDTQGNKDKYATLPGITYGPYVSSTGACKTETQVLDDIKNIRDAGFGSVRVYGTDCDTLPSVVKACVKYDLKLIIGVFIKDQPGCSVHDDRFKKQLADIQNIGNIKTAKKIDNWSIVKLVVVGNEAIFNRHCTPAQLATLMQAVRKGLPGRFRGDLTTAETVNILMRPDVAAALCPHMTVIGANIHPFFRPNLELDAAGKFVLGQVAEVSGMCKKHGGPSTVVNLECGYKAKGDCLDGNCPSPKAQFTVIKAVMEACNQLFVVYLGFDDEGWKGKDGGWGVLATAKQVMLLLLKKKTN